MRNILALILTAFATVAQSYLVPQLPRLSSVSSTDFVPVWSGTNLYAATATIAGAFGKLDATNGTASGLTVIGGFSTSGGTSPLRVDDANNLVHINGSGGSTMPFNVIGNIMRVGADDGAITLRSVTAGTDKDFNLCVYTKDNNEFMVMRAIGASGNVLYLGGGSGGYKQSTRIYFSGAASISATSSTIYGTLDGINGEWGLGSSSTTSGSVLTVNSTTKSAIPFPRQTTAQWIAYSQVAGSGVYDTSVSKIGVSDGTTRRYLSEELTGSVVWDIPNITTGTEQTTTVTVTGAATGDQVLIDFPRPAANVLLVAQVTSANTVTLYAMNTGAAIDPASRTYYVTVKRR
jgi:hypothetical protein